MPPPTPDDEDGSGHEAPVESPSLTRPPHVDAAGAAEAEDESGGPPLEFSPRAKSSSSRTVRSPVCVLTFLKNRIRELQRK